MGKIKHLALVFMVMMLFTLCSCATANVVEYIDIKSDYEKTVTYGEFDPENYTIVRTYTNGSTDEIKVSKDMIDSYNMLKAYQPGNQSFEVKYMNKSLYIDVTITKKKFDLTVKDKTVVYDGNSHSLDIVGYIPAGAKSYSLTGTSFTNVGAHNVSVTYVCDDYENITLQATLTITKLTLDISDYVSFSNAEYDYDEKEHSIEINGKLPKNVDVKYYINGVETNKATDAGVYNVVAQFTPTDPTNINSISSLSAQLIIKKKVYETDSISIGQAYVSYTGEDITWVVTQRLPEWIDVSYENNVQREPGNYTVRIKLKINNPNYCFVGEKDEITISRAVTISKQM